MPSSPDILIADGITTALNAATFGQAFTAERLYSAEWDARTELDSLQVGVWPGESAAEPWERGQLFKGYTTGITTAKRVTKALTADLDDLMDLVNEVTEFLELGVIAAGGIDYVNQGWEYVVRFDDSQLMRTKDSDSVVRYTGLFASVIVYEFKSLE